MTIVRTTTPAGEAIVILPEAEFERLQALAEDTLDARALDASETRLRNGDEEMLDEADLDALRAAPSPIAFWRERRGKSLEELALACAVDPIRLAAIEHGSDAGDPVIYERLARTLKVDVEDLS